MTKMSSGEAPDVAALSQDNVLMSEMDKAAMLAMIREEVPLLTHAQPDMTKNNPFRPFMTFICFSGLPIRSSRKRSRSTSGRGNTRSAESRSWR